MQQFVPRPFVYTNVLGPAVRYKPPVMPPFHAQANPVYISPLAAALAARARTGFGHRP